MDEWFGKQLQSTWPDAQCELVWNNHWQLLVAVICSARASDDRVNLVLQEFWECFPTMQDAAIAYPPDLGQAIRRLPLWQQKSRAIVESARYLMEHHQGVVPSNPQDLIKLPGVGRKTAAVVAGNGFGIPSIAADVHVQRILPRWGWTEKVDERQSEQAIAHQWPADDWVSRCHQLIRLGRAWCRPKRPWCSKCVCRHQCPQIGVEDAR